MSGFDLFFDWLMVFAVVVGGVFVARGIWRGYRLASNKQPVFWQSTDGHDSTGGDLGGGDSGGGD
jgi:hypothetical protein